jgi:hypothetical protein
MTSTRVVLRSLGEDIPTASKMYDTCFMKKKKNFWGGVVYIFCLTWAVACKILCSKKLSCSD